MFKLPFTASAVLLTGLSLMATHPLQADRREIGNLVLKGMPEIPERISRRLHQYQNTRSASLQGWHPSGEGILISTRFGETNQLHWVKRPGGARQQLTFFDEPVSGVAVSQHEKLNSAVVGRDVGGSENFQLYRFDLASGVAKLLTDGTSRNSAPSLSRAGDRMVYVTNRRNGKSWDIHLLDLAAEGESQPVLEAAGAWFPGSWSPDDRRVLVAQYVSANESYPFILDLESGELEALHRTSEQVAYSAADWAPDGKGMYFASDEGSEFLHLRYRDLSSGEEEVLTAHIPWNVGSVVVAPDGKHMAFTVNQDGVSKLHLWQLPSRRPAKLPQLPPGQVFGIGFSPDSRRLGLTLVSSQTPGDAYVVDLANAEVERWTYSEVGGLDSNSFVLPDLVHYDTFDEVDGEARQIPAFYYRPRGSGKFPVVINIHGGPEGQFRPTFNPNYQFMVEELGVAVLAPNVRGSSGYGKTYLKLDNGFLREDSVQDIGKLLDWIEVRPELDASRVVVMGGSYGGYMVLASMTHYNDRLRGGIDVVGISNFVTFLENTKGYRRDLRRVEYGDERDAEMRRHLLKISPTTNARKITRPLFIAQGLNDPRVPASEAEQIFDVVKKNGGSPWYMLAKDEGHGFRKKSNRDFYNSAVALFLEQVLLQGAPGAAASAGEPAASGR